jgi:hypothetical protein
MKPRRDIALSWAPAGLASRDVAIPLMLLTLWFTIMQPPNYAMLWGMGYAGLVAWLGYRLWEQFGPGDSASTPTPVVVEPAPVQEILASGAVDPSKVFEATIVLQRLEDRGVARGLNLYDVLEVLGHLTPRNPGGHAQRGARAS